MMAGELSRAGALGASQFGFDALYRVLRPEPCDELLDAAAKGARMRMRCSSREDVRWLWRSILDIG